MLEEAPEGEIMTSMMVTWCACVCVMCVRGGWCAVFLGAWGSLWGLQGVEPRWRGVRTVGTAALSGSAPESPALRPRSS